MAKGKFWDDTFEQLAELGMSTGKKTIKAVAQTINPLSAFDKQTGDGTAEVEERGGKTSEVKKRNNHTPLDFEKLKEKYQNGDAQKTQALKKHLFDLVKGADERLLMEKKQKEMEKKRQEALEEQDRRKKEQERYVQQDDTLPHGKVRRSIFSKKKVATEQHAEMKPATGKQ